MDQSAKLREIIARLLEMDAAGVVNGLPLNHRALQGSAGRAKLDAIIRRELGMKCPAVYSAKTYAELESAILGTPAPAASEPGPALATPAPAALAPMPSGGLMCGIDMESVEAMPPAEDYWKADFYKQFFSPREIAYCVSQSEPRQHFAARWCAKKALKKCDPAFLSLDFGCIETVHDDHQRPLLKILQNGEWVRVPHAVSLSHTAAFAVAMVMAPVAAPGAAPAATTVPAASPTEASRRPAAEAPAPKGVLQKIFGR